MIVKHASIKMKLFLILLSIMILITVLVSMTLYSQAKSSIQKQTADAIKGSITLTVENIDNSLKNIENTFVPIAINDEHLHDILSTEKPFDRYEMVMNYSYILGNLRNLSSQIKGLDSYSLYIDNQQDLLDTKSTFYMDVKPSEIDFMRRFPKNHADQLWFVTHPYGSIAANKKAVISSVRVIQNQDYKALGYISLNVNEAYIYNLFAKLGQDVQSVILDKQDTIISSADKSTIGTYSKRYSSISTRIHASEQQSGSFEYEEGGQTYLAVYSSSVYTNWLFINLIPMEQIIGEVSKIRLFMIEVIGVTSLLILAVSYMVSFLFYKPIRKLVVAMKRIENRDLTIKIVDSRRDEYQRVYQGFNDMVDNLNSLMNDLTSEKILKKEAEIKMLQAQMNPHFLYNTLESIHSIAKIYGVDEISKMVLALSNYFRSSLSGGKEFVTLGEALNMIEYYITIQKIRFKGKISHEIFIPEYLHAYLVPKFVLQPIVENAIYHGIERKRGDGMLIITSDVEGDTLSLIVEDDGMGILDADLRKLWSNLEQSSKENTEHFALKNLNQQIKLTYGPDYGIDVQSEYGLGTTVTIKLPISKLKG